MPEAMGICSLMHEEVSPSLRTYVNVVDRLLLMSAGIESAEARQQLEEIAETYERLESLCANFKNLKPRLTVTGPIFPD